MTDPNFKQLTDVIKWSDVDLFNENIMLIWHELAESPQSSRYGYHAMKSIFAERSLRQSLHKM